MKRMQWWEVALYSVVLLIVAVAVMKRSTTPPDDQQEVPVEGPCYLCQRAVPVTECTSCQRPVCADHLRAMEELVSGFPSGASLRLCSRCALRFAAV